MRLAWLFVVCALLAPAPPAAAQDQDWYAVEVIVFAHRDDASTRDEQWAPNPGEPDVTGATAVLPPTEPRTLRAFEQLGPAALQMGGAWRTLQASSRYLPLVHVGWRQPGLGPDAAVPVRIDLDSGTILPPEPLETLEPEIDDGLADDAFVDEAPLEVEGDPLDEPVVEEPPVTNPWLLAERLRDEYAVQPVPPPLIGTVTLLLQRFLHVGVDLLLTSDEPLPLVEGERDWRTERENILADLTFELIGYDEARARLDALNARPRTQAYRLVEQRRVRTTELHYFDHPKFGAIVSVRPIPAEEIEALRAAPPLDVEPANEF